MEREQHGVGLGGSKDHEASASPVATNDFKVEKRKRYHQALLSLYHPPSPPQSPPPRSSQLTEDELLAIACRDIELNLDQGDKSNDGSHTDDGEPRKLSRAQRKRLRKRKLKEHASSTPRKIIGPLLPSSNSDQEEPSKNSVSVIPMVEPGDRPLPARPADVAPRTAAAYLDPRYWDKRFSAEEHYEWFKDYSHFQHLLRPFLKPTHSVLEIGCGNSRLCEELRRDGMANVTCIDISPVAVERMRNRLRDMGLEGIKVLQADMLDLPFDSESFDVVIEKGTMDVLFVDSGDPWKPRSETLNKVKKMLEGVHKVLKPEGTFISISFGQPHFRRPLFESPGFTWTLECSTFGEGFHYFFYILRKGTRSTVSDECQIGRPSVPSINMLHEEMEDEDYIFRTTLCEELESQIT